MRGGRSYSRGGRGGGGSSYRGNSNSSYRGSYHNSYGGESQRGSRYGGYENHSYNSRSNSSRYQGSSNRYPSNRPENYKRPYSSRDRSPERKRSRNEDGGSRRGLDYGETSSGYGGSRYSESSYTRRTEQSRPSRPPPRLSPPARSSFRPRESSSSSHRSRERMGPPKSMAPRRYRGGSNLRTSYRGRGTLSRGIRRTRVTYGNGSTTIDRRRRQLFLINRSRDILIRRRKIARVGSSYKSDDESEAATKTSENGKVDAETASNDGVSPKKSSKSSKPKATDDVATNGSGDEKEAAKEEEDGAEAGSDDAAAKRPAKVYVKLVCVHCNVQSRSFKTYEYHLRTRRHADSLRRVALKQKAILAHMRNSQRNAQREIEEKMKDADSLNSQFCMLCRLNYCSEKSVHQLSSAHRNMKKFLMPYCSSCQQAFKSPMEYEMHRVSISHLRRKDRSHEAAKDTGSEGEDDCNLDLGQFMTVDSIGDVDMHDDEDGAATATATTAENGVSKVPKPDINVGSEHCKKVEVFYCELCRYYLPHNEDLEAALKKHCGIRSHLRSYLRYKENQDLRLAAEKIHRKHQEQREARKEKIAKEAEKKAETPAKDEVEDNGDKIWADVDKDLGELLQEVVTENANDDEDEDSTTTTERYDRFKNSGQIVAKETADLETSDKTVDALSVEASNEIATDEITAEVLSAVVENIKVEK